MPMTTRKSTKKAPQQRGSASQGMHTATSPKGAERAKPGETGKGDYFHIEVMPKGGFDTFRTQDVGKAGGIERVAGRRGSGSWDTQAWLISKNLAHLEGEKLVADSDDAREVLAKLGSAPTHIEGDRFEAEPRPNVPESEKPTPTQTRARRRNIKKAQEARHAS